MTDDRFLSVNRSSFHDLLDLIRNDPVFLNITTDRHLQLHFTNSVYSARSLRMLYSYYRICLIPAVEFLFGSWLTNGVKAAFFVNPELGLVARLFKPLHYLLKLQCCPVSTCTITGTLG
jgi:hypothetical protein